MNFTFPMTTQQFAKVMALLLKEPSVYVDSHTEDRTAGTIDTPQVGMSYSYNGIDTLTVSVTERHGIAKFASAATIQSHLSDMLRAAEQ